MTIKEKIAQKIESMDWKFEQLLKLNNLTEKLAEEFVDELSLEEKMKLVWDITITTIPSGQTFGTIFNGLIKTKLSNEITKVFQEKFDSATVSFGASPEILEEKAPPFPQDSKQKSAILSPNTPEQDIDITKNTDEVQTRGGNIKVKRV